MNYIGSKHSLLHFIETSFKQIADGSEKTFGDLFAGTGAVGRLFKRRGLRVIANDIQHYAYVLNKAHLEIDEPPAFTELSKACKSEIARYKKSSIDAIEEVLKFINHIEGRRGFITDHYAPAGNRFYYTEENAERADAIRQTLEAWRREKVINEQEYFYLLASLIEAIDQVANTASVYGAYLKQFKSSARY